MPTPKVLIAGMSARAAAESAARAGFEVAAIDAFGDLDAHYGVRSLSSLRGHDVPFTPHAVAVAARDIAADAVVYLAGFENDPEAVRDIAAGRVLWGNPPDVLERVRNPLMLMDAFRRRGIPAPDVLVKGANAPNDPNEWLIKPLASGGGHGIRPWRSEIGRSPTVPPAWYLQRRVEGTPASVVFVAARGRAVPLAVSRQLAGDAAFGAEGYRYCGNIVAAGDPAFTGEARLVAAASSLAAAVAEEFGLVGLNGVDFIACDGAAYPIEVNPRWCASMELVERRCARSLFEIHAAACERGELPDADLLQAGRRAGAAGKAVVFARGGVVMGDTRAWLDDSTVRDVPHPGERIATGHPICTVLAEAPDAAACYEALARRAGRIYAEIDARR